MNAPAGRNQLSTPIGGTQCERKHQGGMTFLNRRVVTPALVKLDWRI